MRKLLLSFLAILISNICFAQDIIVKKNGKTFMAKVIEVGSNEVKYTLNNSSDKNTHTINITDLLAINYENGKKEVFDTSDTTTNNTINNNNNVILKEGLSNYISLDKQLQAENLYKKSTINKYMGVGCIVAGTGITLLCAYLGVHGVTHDGSSAPFFIAVPFIAGGTIGACYFFKKSSKLKSQAREVLSCSIIQHEYVFGDYALCPSVDVITDTNNPINKSVGVGFKLKF